MAHPALGRLWDRAQPCSDAFLDQLVAVHPLFVLGYLPPGASRVWDVDEGRWAVYERSGDPAWQRVGAYRLARYESQGKRVLTPDIVAGCHAMMDGLHFVAAFPESQVGSERMLEDLRAMMAATRTYRAAIDQGQAALEREQIEAELAENDALRRDLMEKYQDVAPVFLTGRHSVVVDGFKPRPSLVEAGV